MNAVHLRRVPPDAVTRLGRSAPDQDTLRQVADIVRDVRELGEPALRAHAERLGDLYPGEPLVLGRDHLKRALAQVPKSARDLLTRAAERIRTFARAQRRCLSDLSTNVPGGRAGHTLLPVEVAGCYAPGGRFPLPSSVLMTAVTARVAGVKTVIVASPRPAPVTLAAASVAEADMLLQVGGAQAIAGLGFGAGPIPACDVVVGPGNQWVTAAKQIVAGSVAIDMLAGPSELVILADGSADAATIAADLLAQAEHDPDALPVLVATKETLIAGVERELATQLADLPTAEVARCALQRGFAVPVSGVAEGIEVCDRLAPEHLALHVVHPKALMTRLKHYGAVFVGAASAEAFGDYGIGPNHVLPTGATARAFSGLSVFTFLRVRTWLQLTDRSPTSQDAADFARLEGLEAHARSVERRLV